MKTVEHQILGLHLKEKRLSLGFTQNEIAKKLKVHIQFVSNWERGVCPPPSHCLQKLFDLVNADRRKIADLMIEASTREIEERIFNKKKGKAG